MKIVLDTNILIAIVGRRSPYRWLFDCLIEGRIALCVSNEIMFEYREVLERKSSHEVAENVINFIDMHPSTVHTPIYFKFGLITEDPDDNKFVDCAITSNAKFLVSNDAHFRALGRSDFPKVRVLSLDEFEKRFREVMSS